MSGRIDPSDPRYVKVLEDVRRQLRRVYGDDPQHQLDDQGRWTHGRYYRALTISDLRRLRSSLLQHATHESQQRRPATPKTVRGWEQLELFSS